MRNTNRRAGRRRLAAVSLALVVASGACSMSGLRYTADKRIEVVSPRPGATVELPVTLRWRAEGLTLAKPGSSNGVYFAVFVDRAPLAPGVGLVHLVDEACKRSGHGCATLEYFAEHNVYLTSQTSLQLSAVPDLARHDPGRYVHRVEVVLMSADQRVGESVASTMFRVRPSSAGA